MAHLKHSGLDWTVRMFKGVTKHRNGMERNGIYRNTAEWNGIDKNATGIYRNELEWHRNEKKRH